MRPEIQAYINRINNNDASLREIKITEGSLDGFDQLTVALSQNTAMARQIGTLQLLKITESLDLNLTAFIRLRNLDLTSSNVQNLQLPPTIDVIKLTRSLCSTQVQELAQRLVSAVRSEVIYDSEYSDVESYDSANEAAEAEEQKMSEEVRVTEKAQVAEEEQIAEEQKMAEEVQVTEKAQVAEEEQIAEEQDVDMLEQVTGVFHSLALHNRAGATALHTSSSEEEQQAGQSTQARSEEEPNKRVRRTNRA
jgi:hypothetical protein